MSRCDSCANKNIPRGRPVHQPYVAPRPQVSSCPAPMYVKNDLACDCDFTIDQLASCNGSTGTKYRFMINGCSAMLDIKNGVKAGETETTLVPDNMGNLIYNGEKREFKINIPSQLNFARIEDLGNVGNNSGDDRSEFPEGCGFLHKAKGNDYWNMWKAKENIISGDDKPAGIMVFTKNGCPRYLPAPENGLATLVARDGEVKWEVIDLPPEADKNKFHPAWGNINEGKGVYENGTYKPDRRNGIFTHNPQQDECNDIIYG